MIQWLVLPLLLNLSSLSYCSQPDRCKNINKKLFVLHLPHEAQTSKIRIGYVPLAVLGTRDSHGWSIIINVIKFKKWVMVCVSVMWNINIKKAIFPISFTAGPRQKFSRRKIFTLLWKLVHKKIWQDTRHMNRDRPTFWH